MTNIIKEINRTEQLYDLFSKDTTEYTLGKTGVVDIDSTLANLFEKRTANEINDSYYSYIAKSISNSLGFDSDLIDSSSFQSSLDFSILTDTLTLNLPELNLKDSEISYSTRFNSELEIYGSDLPNATNIYEFLDFIAEQFLAHYSNDFREFNDYIYEQKQISSNPIKKLIKVGK